jgi:hypothetical protein
LRICQAASPPLGVRADTGRRSGSRVGAARRAAGAGAKKRGNPFQIMARQMHILIQKAARPLDQFVKVEFSQRAVSASCG